MYFFFFHSDISDESWENVALILEVIRFLIELIIRIPTNLLCENWDFILISLASWQVSVNKSKHNFNDLKVSKEKKHQVHVLFNIIILYYT